MVQGATTTFTLTFPSSVDFSDAEHIVFTCLQDYVAVSKDETEMTINANVVEVTLTQADTLMFSTDSKAKIQLNWTYADGTRMASNVVTIPIDENLYKDVIE